MKCVVRVEIVLELQTMGKSFEGKENERLAG